MATTGLVTVGTTLGVTGLLTASGHIQMAASGEIRDSGGAARITVASTSVQVAITGDATISGTLDVASTVAVGGNAGIDADKTLNVMHNNTGTSVNVRGAYVEQSRNAASGANLNVFGLQGVSRTILSGTGTTASCIGLDFIARSESSKTVNSLIGIRIATNTTVAGSGAITASHGILVSAASWSSDVPTTTNGIEIRDQGGTGATAYGLRILTQTGTTIRNISEEGTTGTNVLAAPTLIGANAIPATSAVLELQSTTGALLLSRLTTTQRDALTAVDGMIIYNSTTTAFNFRENGAWVTGSGLI